MDEVEGTGSEWRPVSCQSTRTDTSKRKMSAIAVLLLDWVWEQYLLPQRSNVAGIAMTKDEECNGMA
jgi:hypothetical protein